MVRKMLIMATINNVIVNPFNLPNDIPKSIASSSVPIKSVLVPKKYKLNCPVDADFL